MKIKVNGIELEKNKVYSTKFFEEKKPYITSTLKDHNNLYTTIMVDPDAPYPSNPTAKYHLHLLVVNSIDIKSNYKPPNPPEDSPPHRYQTLLYIQSKHISINTIDSRLNFDLVSFVKNNKLELVDKFEFKCKK